MAEMRAEYRALVPIMHNGVRAYSPGDPVDARVVQGRSDTGWVDPDDVEPSGVIPLEQPARNASQGRWAEYAVAQGADREEAAGMSRAALIETYGGERASEPAEPAAAHDEDPPGGHEPV